MKYLLDKNKTFQTKNNTLNVLKFEDKDKIKLFLFNMYNSNIILT
jgi:hypothetical protein